jgi:type II secretory ATPase GspE/PulE/Tfp pilus assembly ATPase PilB-like protein
MLGEIHDAETAAEDGVVSASLTGHLGRTGSYEMLSVDGEIRDFLTREAGGWPFREAVRAAASRRYPRTASARSSED